MTRFGGTRTDSNPVQVRMGTVRVPLTTVIAAWLFRRLWAAVWFLLTRPLLLLVLVGAWLTWRVTLYRGPVPVAVLAAVLLVGLVVWRWRWPESFTRLLIWRVRGSWRAVTVYRYAWQPAMVTAGLHLTRNGQELLPTLRSVRTTGCVDLVRVRMLPGQTILDYTAAADRLAQTFGFVECRDRSVPRRPHDLALWFLTGNPLAKPVPVVDPGESTDPTKLRVGLAEDGMAYLMRLLGTHLLTVGATGSGKGSVLWSLIVALCPGIRDRTVQVWALDPKGAMELAFGKALFARFVYGDPDDGTAYELAFAKALEDAVAVMRRRQSALRGKTRLHQPSVQEPLLVVVIDEIAFLTAYVTDRDAKRRIEAALALLLSQGRAVGVLVVGAVQDHRKDVIALRDLFPTRVALRLVEADAVDMVLGRGAHSRGARCDQIPENLPGVGYVVLDGVPEPVRVRFSHVTDQDIAQLVARYVAGATTPTPSTPADGEPVRPQLHLVDDAPRWPTPRRTRVTAMTGSVVGERFAGFGEDAPRDLPDLDRRTSAEVVARLLSPDSEDWSTEAARVGHCARPIRLHGTCATVDRATGEVLSTYASTSEPLGVLHVRCGNRRASDCPSCSRLYAADMFQLIRAGVVGGKTVPDTVADNPLVFVTLTAPSFGPVHGLRDGKRCRPHPSKDTGPTCPHGLPTTCRAVHADEDPLLGQPLCGDCYNYLGHIVWQWWAPELWRQYTITLKRAVADRLGVDDSQLHARATVQYAKVGEYQRRGLIHFHGLVRLDGPRTDGGFAPAPAGLDATALAGLIRQTAAAVTLTAPPLHDGDAPRVLRFGVQVDARPVRPTKRTDDPEQALTAEQVAGYLAKYATKSATDTCPDGGGNPHLTRLRALLVETAGRVVTEAYAAGLYDWQAIKELPYGLLGKWTHMLGFRGHFASKSRRYSVTLGQLRRARTRYQRRVADAHRRGEPLELADVDLDRLLLDEDDQETTLVVGTWGFAGAGWNTQATPNSPKPQPPAPANTTSTEHSSAGQITSRANGSDGEGKVMSALPNEVRAPQLLTVDKAAAWCRITKHTLNHLRFHGRFAPAIKIGKRCFWTPEDLLAWLEQQRETR